MSVIFSVIRGETQAVPGKQSYTPGVMYYNGLNFCLTCEDADRKMEAGNVTKVYGETAIPRGKYQVVLSFSNHFQKQLPEVLHVPGFSGVRIHGGNKAEDSEGCLLVGKVRTSTGIAQCAETVSKVCEIITAATKRGETVYLEIK